MGEKPKSCDLLSCFLKSLEKYIKSNKTEENETCKRVRIYVQSLIIRRKALEKASK
jgi:hypothetical protein